MAMADAGRAFQALGDIDGHGGCRKGLPGSGKRREGPWPKVVMTMTDVGRLGKGPPGTATGREGPLKILTAMTDVRRVE